MPYSRLLKRIIAESGYSCKEIVDKCREIGGKMDKSYLSKLMNDKLPPPSEEISATIAKACNADERQLVLEGYIDKAPKEIKDAFCTIKFVGLLTAMKLLENVVDKSALDVMKQEMEKEPIADFVLDFIRNAEQAVALDLSGTEVLKVHDNEIKFTIDEPVAIPIKDNAMFPIVPEGSKITLRLKVEYSNGDLIALKLKDEEDIIVRYVLFENDNIILTAINKQYSPISCNKEEISILGEVAKVITEL